MRSISIISLLLLFLFNTNLIHGAKLSHKSHNSILDNISIDVEDDVIILSSTDDPDEFVEITPSYELYVNGREVDLSRSQKHLIKSYYKRFFEILDFATEIGQEGARIGVLGAEIGIKAAGKAVKAIFSDYEIDEMEEELEEDSEELEELVREIEERAEELEEMADEFEDLHYELRSEIDELNALYWF
jgi:hypothetical protein